MRCLCAFGAVFARWFVVLYLLVRLKSTGSAIIPFRIGNHYFACWCSVKGQPGMLPTGWEAGNTYWRRFIRRNGRFIFNIESQSECYYYWVYCCTPITVLAVYLSRWRQNATLPSTIVYWRSLHFIPYVTMIGHWARKFNDQSTRNLFKRFLPNRPSGSLFPVKISSVEVIHKNPVLSEKTWLYLSKRSAYLGILVIQPASIFCNLLIFLLPKSQRTCIFGFS